MARFQQSFTREQLLLFRSEDLFGDGATVWIRVQAFLELKPVPFPTEVAPDNAGRGEAAAVPESVREHLRYQPQPPSRQLEDMYAIRLCIVCVYVWSGV